MIEQRSHEWLVMRRYMLTASNFGAVLAGANTKRHKALVRDIVNAFIGVPDFDSDQDDKLQRNPWFKHGVEWEDEAIREYEFATDNVVEKSGLIIHPRYDFIGCSPDGLVDVNGGVEVKSRRSIEAYNKSVMAGVERVYIPQIQGCMWVTGRAWWDYISFYKRTERNFLGETVVVDKKLHHYRVYRDDIYIAELEQACLSTWDEVQQLLQEKRNGKRS